MRCNQNVTACCGVTVKLGGLVMTMYNNTCGETKATVNLCALARGSKR